MLGWLKGAGEVGIFSVAQRPIQLLYIFPLIIGIALFPTFTKLIRENETKKASQLLEETMTFLVAISLPIFLIGVILARDIVLFFFGGEYLTSVQSFQILLFTLPLVFSATVIANAILAYDKQQDFMKLLGFTALVNVVLNFLLIPRWGGLGAALSLLGAFSIIYIFAWREIKQMIAFSLLPRLKRPIFAAILAAGTLILGKLVAFHPSLNLTAAVAIYLAALIPAVDLWPPIKKWLKGNN